MMKNVTNTADRVSPNFQKRKTLSYNKPKKQEEQKSDKIREKNR